MDKILHDVMKQRIQNSADRDAKRRFQRSPRTPGSTPVKPSSNSSPSKVSTETPPTTAVGTSSSSMVTPVAKNTENSDIKPQEMETASSAESQNTAVK